jgi:asparagine synthase (glutamine-hydrolysing)
VEFDRVSVPLFGDSLDECRRVVSKSVDDCIGDCVMLSGGLDTSIVTHLAFKTEPTCYTVFFPYGRSPDLFYAKSVAKKLGLKWRVAELSPAMLDSRLSSVIGVLNTFDPMEVRNSVAVYQGLLEAACDGFSHVVTGDGADELFAGYNFIFNLEPSQMMLRLRQLWSVMRFSSREMAQSLRMSASLPYLGRDVVEFVKELGPQHLVGQRKGKKYGKFILRVAFEDLIGKRLAWRKKTPVEHGSGTTALSWYYSEKIGDNEFLEEKRRILRDDRVIIRDKEHLHYYKLFRNIYPPPVQASSTPYRCPSCWADAPKESTFCVVCGAYPISVVEVD